LRTLPRIGKAALKKSRQNPNQYSQSRKSLFPPTRTERPPNTPSIRQSPKKDTALMRQINSPRLKAVLDQPKQTLGSIFEKTKLIPSNLQACQTKLQLFKRIKQNLAQNNIFIYKLLLQSCLTLCDPTDSSPTGSSVPGILQPRILEWAAISFSNV